MLERAFQQASDAFDSGTDHVTGVIRVVTREHGVAVCMILSFPLTASSKAPS